MLIPALVVRGKWPEVSTQNLLITGIADEVEPSVEITEGANS
jgi:hypothetical protein